MTKIKYIYLLLISAFLFAACGKEDSPGNIVNLADNEIAIDYSQKKYVSVVAKQDKSKSIAETRNIIIEEGDENKIDNLYILMVNSDWSDIKRYYTSSATFTQGEWDAIGKRVKIKLPQSQAAQRDVYVIANVSTELKTTLDGVTTLVGLQQALVANESPWSPNLSNASKSILMSGKSETTHDFTANRLLQSVTLVRAVAKVELNVKLSAKHQAAPTYLSNGNQLPNYQYNFVDFDKNTYVLENTTKSADVASTGNSADTPVTWVPFSATGTDHVSSYEVDEMSGLVTNLKIVTYINETTNANSYIELQLPYEDGGFLPPPEFGPETFILPRQGEIKRNHWYKYDVEL